MDKPNLKALLAARGLRLVDLAERLGVDKSQATRWAKLRIPADRVLAVEKATRISRKLLRPDLYQ